LYKHFTTVSFTNGQSKTKIFEAAAIASYRIGKGSGPPVVTKMMCDDAPQFKLIFEELALCWVHDGRHYKKLCPVVPFNAQELNDFIDQYWDYYHKLLDYKKIPLPETAESLSVEFDQLFSTKTGYNDLDDRILKTKNKKDNLLLVLQYPEIPLHNNASELAARVMARERDVSLHTMTDEGTKANDTFLTIVETAKKLGVNQFEYIVDRVSKKYQMPSLAKNDSRNLKEQSIENGLSVSYHKILRGYIIHLPQKTSCHLMIVLILLFNKHLGIVRTTKTNRSKIISGVGMSEGIRIMSKICFQMRSVSQNITIHSFMCGIKHE